MRFVTTRHGRLFALAIFLSLAFAWIQHAGIFQDPDLVLQPDLPVLIAAGSANQSHHFEIPSQQIKDRWIRGFVFHPGDSRVIRSAFFYIDKTNQWLGAWSPDQKMTEFPDTVAASLPAGSKVIMEIYYQSVAEDVEDRSSLALYFTDKKPLRPLTGMGVETHVQVPAGSGEIRVRKEFTVISDSYALAVRPEMASGAQSVYVARLDPAGASQVLLALPEFKQDAQSPYTFEQPVFLPKGTRIVAEASYLNSDARAVDDLFKVTMSMYPSAEHRPAPDPALAGKKAAAKKTTAKKSPAKKAPANTP